MASPAIVPANTPIAQLNPDLKHDDSSVAGIVTLIWPYAASKSTFSVLLVDPDFRLRSNRGQVRVHFQGSSAKAVARSGLISGDQLLLSLRGAQWVKDSTAATTPGRGIDWQLQYGERLVLQIHRPSQQPTTLDIDHPTPSPDPPLQTSTPVQSPPHNNHYASSTGTALLDAQSWASPAFLKRSRILSTDYDPFIEDEFPDNDRKKRTKFGRGSDQWRFAERTPSPDKESETPPPEIASPSRPPAQDRPKVEEFQPFLQEAHSTRSPPVPSSSATKDLIDRSELEVLSEGDFIAKDTSLEDREGPSTLLGQVDAGGQMIYEDTRDGNIGNKAVVTHESPCTKVKFNEVDVEASTTRPTNPIYDAHSVGDEESREQAQTVKTSPLASIGTSSSAFSSSAPRNDSDLDKESDQASDDATHQESDSLFDEQSEPGQSNAVVRSGSGSDVGLDGSTFSRPPPGVELATPPSIIKRLEERQETGPINADDAQHTPLPLQSDVEQTGSEAEEPSVSKHSASDSLSSEDGASEADTENLEDHDAAQRRSSVQAPSPDELGSPDTGVIGDQAFRDLIVAQLSTSNPDSWEDMGTPQENRVPRSSSNLPLSPYQFETQKPQELLVLSTEEISNEKPVPELNPEHEATESRGRKSLSSSVEEIDSLAASDVENTLYTSPEKGPMDSTGQQESRTGHQHEIVLDAKLHQESLRTVQPQDQEFKERSDHSRTMPSMTTVAQLSTVEIIDLESGDEDNDVGPHDVAQNDFPTTADESDSRFTPTQRVSPDKTPLMLASDASNEDQTSIDDVSSLSTVPEFTKLVLKSATEVNDSPPAGIGIHIEPEAHEEALESAQEGSRTQSPVARSERFLEEPPSIQEAPLVQSEATPKSLERELPSEDKAHLKKVETSETELMSIPVDELPSTVPDSFDELKSKSQLLTPGSTQQTNLVSQSSSVALHSVHEDDTLPTPRLTQAASVEPAPPQRLASPAPAPPKKTSTLIERLKEMRRLSSQSPRPRPSDASILDPWFAPRRLSQVVPDSEDGSEAESSPERKAQTRMPEIASERLPQTPEKPLAKSFIRSPPQPEHISSIQSSPQYLPPSQPPPPGFRTNLSYFVPLATMPSHFATTVDILAIALSSTPVTRATSGPKDYNQSLYITDPSSLTLQHTVTTVQIFRPNNRCFPIVEKGAALLLRDFKVQPFEKRLLLLSTESSAWAVFRKGADVQIRGPPVEYGAAERGFARGLWDWWASLGDGARRQLETAVPEHKKPNGANKINKSTAGGNKRDATIKTEEIEGLGLDLSGSQSKRRESVEERSVALDGVEERDMVYESIEAPKRVLRARGAKGVNGRSESARESRFGTVFTGGLGEPDETQGSAHELRDGKAYRAKGR